MTCWKWKHEDQAPEGFVCICMWNFQGCDNESQIGLMWLRHWLWNQETTSFSPALGLKPAEWLWVIFTSSSPLGEGKEKLLLSIFIIASKIAGPFPRRQGWLKGQQWQHVQESNWHWLQKKHHFLIGDQLLSAWQSNKMQVRFLGD